MTPTVDTGRVMGTTVAVTVVGGAMGATHVLERLDELERCWSRFRPDSELSRLNAASGAPTVVSPQLLTLVEHLVVARQLTGGRFDPTMGRRLVELGYDRTYRDLAEASTDSSPTAPTDASPLEPWGFGGDSARRIPTVDVLPSARIVRLAEGVALDPGGLGKGLAGDIVAAEAMAAGATGVLVDVGGDVVVSGDAPDGGPWRIGDEHDRVIELHDGAVATSDTTVRRWRHGGRDMHHVLDPATGEPLDRDLRVTVVAGAGWWAEALTTAVMVSETAGDGWAATVDQRLGARAVIVSTPEVSRG